MHEGQQLYQEDGDIEEKLQQNIQDDDKNSSITLLRIPFYTKSQSTLQKMLTSDILQKISDKQECINLQFNKNNKQSFNVNIFKKKLIRAMQLLRVKKLINKKTGKTVKIIKKAQNIETLYDYEQLGDFINSLGSQQLYHGEKRFQLNQEDILKRLTGYLTEKIQSEENDKIQNEQQRNSNNNDDFLPLIQPLFYLKSYNLVPPSYDLLVNKIRPNGGQKNSTVCGKSINYEDEIPQSQSVDIPKYISDSQLYKKVQKYLQKRPCWLKNSLYYTLYQDGMKNQFTVNDFKNVMKYSAFTYRNGPWKHTFCRFGFDPKKEFKSLIFQSVTIKIKQKQVEDYENEIQQEVYDPTFQQVSNRFVRSYQLCDIAHETVRQIVQGKLISKQGECLKQYGWLNMTQHGKIMKTMKLRIQELNNN